MALVPQTRFGDYEIVALLGAGGMGEVYLAIDLTLGRSVAIKTLPAVLASDADRLARFEREARTLAALSHQNIAHIYGLSHSGGIHAFVMELVEGPTLADRLFEGPLPAEEALAIALQIAAGLEAAHEQGIVHRDLKPANIKLKQDGTVKVLDFGIAKSLFMTRTTSGQPAPLATPAATETGIVLGTAAYMSPEQARGKRIDERADVWAFGCVLFEMLTARQPFEADDVATTLARIVEREPDLSLLPDGISPGVRHAIALCLQKDVNKRLADIRDVRLALQGSLNIVGPTTVSRSDAQPFWRRTWPIAAALISGATVAGIAAWTAVAPLPSASVIRFSIPVEHFGGNRPSVSNDGSIVAFGAGDPPQIYIRRIDELEARAVPGTASPTAAICFSPDGSWLSYVEAGSGRLRKVRLTGDNALELAQGVSGTGCHWADDGNIYVSVPGGLARVPERGDSGSVEIIAPRATGDVAYILPQLLPGARRLLAVVVDQSGRHAAVVDIATGKITRVASDVFVATYIPGGPGMSVGHLVMMNANGLSATRLDVDRAAADTRVPVPNLPAGAFAVHTSASGTLIYVDALPAVETRLTWVSRDGTEVPLREPSHAYATGSLSADGKHAATAINAGEAMLDIWSYDIEANLPTRLTFGGHNSPGPFTPDGRHVIYAASPLLQSTAREVRSVARDGSTAPVILASFESSLAAQAWGPTSVSSDSTLLLGTAYRTQSNSDVWMLRLDDGQPNSGRRTTPLLATDSMERHAVFSPDAHFIAYASNDSGREQVYVVPYPLTGAKWQISSDGGAFPQWSATGRELFYMQGTTMMAVAVDTAPAFRFGRASALFQAAGFSHFDRPYGVSPDGERFLMQKLATAPGSTSIHVIVNWAEELRRLLPLSGD